METEHASIERLIPVAIPRTEFDAQMDELMDACRRRDADRVRTLLCIDPAADGDDEVAPEQDGEPDRPETEPDWMTSRSADGPTIEVPRLLERAGSRRTGEGRE